MKAFGKLYILKSKQLVIGLIFSLFNSHVFAAGGGLDSATTEASSIKMWLYAFLGVCVFCYLMYNVIEALLQRKRWSDVLVALGETAAAGGIVVAGTWAWSIWGS